MTNEMEQYEKSEGKETLKLRVFKEEKVRQYSGNSLRGKKQ